MTKRAELLPRKTGETLTDWTLRFLSDGQRKLSLERADSPHSHDCMCVKCELSDYNYRRRSREAEADSRRLRDLYHAVTPREAEEGQ